VARRYKGVTLYRRLMEVLAQSSYRTRTKLLCNALQLLVAVVKMQSISLKQGRFSLPDVIVARLRFGIPTIMKSARFLSIKLRRETSSHVHMSMMVLHCSPF
jgi:hypothetical protein